MKTLLKYTSRFIVIVVALTVIAGCSGTRNLVKPSVEMPTSLGHDSDTTSTIAERSWRHFYTDSVLQSYIEITLTKNRDLLAAAAKVDELAELYGVQKLNYAPSIRGLIGETRETNDYYGEKRTIDPELSVKFTLNWEIDFWGGLSYARKQASARYAGSVEDMHAMQITLIAEVARAYYNLVATKEELNIARQTLLTREQALDKAKLRYDGGLTSELVYQQARVEYATTAALVPGLQNRIILCENALNLLMGRLPGMEVPVNADAFVTEPDAILPVGLPSQVLELRPDVRSAEQALKAALAACGVAWSNQFPKLTIGLTAGWENDEVKNLFRSPFTYILGNITGTILDFGRNRRKYKSTIAAYEQARFKYEKAVLAAFSEVDGAISAYNELRRTTRLRMELRDAAAKYVNLANLQYNGGSINYIDVLDAHRRYFDARTGYSNALRDEFLAMVALYKALGGGWYESPIANPGTDTVSE